MIGQLGIHTRYPLATGRNTRINTGTKCQQYNTPT